MKKIRALLYQLRAGERVRSAGILVGGASLAQIVMLAILPFLTRIYTPEDFTLLSLYIASLGILSSVACLRYEIAVPIAENDTDGLSLLLLSLISSAILSSVVGIIMVFLIPNLGGVGVKWDISIFAWLLPVGMFLLSAYNAFQLWANRKKQFALIAKTRLSQALFGGTAQLTFGWAGYGSVGLLLGHLIYSSAGVVAIVVKNIEVLKEHIRKSSVIALASVASKYSRYPKFSTWEVLANISGIQVPIILIAVMAAGAEAGFLMLAMRVMQAPMALIGSAVGQIYLSHGADEERRGGLGIFTKKTLAGLLKVGVGPLIFAGIVGPVLFTLLFGQAWVRAGIIVSWITPWLVFQFLASPVSMVMHIKNEQKRYLFLTVFGVSLRVGGVFTALMLAKDYVVEVLALTGAAFYLISLCVYGKMAGINRHDVMWLARESLFVLVAWAALGIVCRYTLEAVL